ncbi:MAG: prolipoprotein diacylglyceryl transferase [Planctomycetes bacterium]|nr:prolipoprotein diacylglyceryl transferase [Planctomycetota bacterium]
MMPVVFRIPLIGKDVPGYGLMMMIGFLVSIMWAARRAYRSGASPDVIINCGFVALIAGVTGSRFMYVVHYWDHFAHLGGPIDIAWGVINVSRGGLEYFGGLILATVCVLFYLWRWGYSLRWYLDIIAPSGALGLALGRIGCFLNGCCWGQVCDLPWAVRFPAGSLAAVEQWRDKAPGAGLPEELLYFTPSGLAIPLTRESLRASPEEIAAAEAAETGVLQQLTALQEQYDQATDSGVKQHLARQRNRLQSRARVARSQFADIRAQMKKYNLSVEEIHALAGAHRSLPVHPTQLYAFVAALLLALLLDAAYWRRTRDGQIICLLFVIQPVTRWLLEIIRDDNPHDTLGVLTISQFLAIVLTAAGLLGIWALRRQPPRSPRATLWEPPADDTSEKPPGKRTQPSR